MLKRIATHLRTFRADQRGTTTIEFIVAFPMMVGLIFATLVYFDAAKSHADTQKATYTVGDLLTRYTILDPTRMTEMETLMTNLLPGADGEVEMRVSSISCPETGCRVDWSYVTPDSSFTPLTFFEIPTDRMPPLSTAETVLFVESKVKFVPLLGVTNLAQKEIHTSVFVAPRFISRIPYDDPNQNTSDPNATVVDDDGTVG
ncbi:MAG: TadE/TadG family type IV pilus assembly protein [Rubricella sp.]